MKKILLIAWAVMAFAACGGDDEPTPGPIVNPPIVTPTTVEVKINTVNDFANAQFAADKKYKITVQKNIGLTISQMETILAPFMARLNAANGVTTRAAGDATLDWNGKYLFVPDVTNSEGLTIELYTEIGNPPIGPNSDGDMPQAADEESAALLSAAIAAANAAAKAPPPPPVEPKVPLQKIDFPAEAANDLSKWIADMIAANPNPNKRFSVNVPDGLEFEFETNVEQAFNNMASPSVPGASKKFQFTKDIRIAAIHEFRKWEVHTGTKTANWVWASEKLGTNTDFFTTQDINDRHGQIQIGAAPHNKVRRTVMGWNEGDFAYSDPINLEQTIIKIASDDCVLPTRPIRFISKVNGMELPGGWGLAGFETGMYFTNEGGEKIGLYPWTSMVNVAVNDATIRDYMIKNNYTYCGNPVQIDGLEQRLNITEARMAQYEVKPVPVTRDPASIMAP